MPSKNSPNRVLTGIALFSLVLLALGSCKDDKRTAAEGSQSTQLTMEAFQMNCVIMTKAQVQKWVDSGWTNPANSNTLVKRILLQFYSANGGNAGKNMQLYAIPSRTYTNVYLHGRETLQIDTTCTPVDLSGPVALANNYVGFSALGITNADGSLKDFDFIRFKPRVSQQYAPYLVFDVEVVKIVDSKETLLFSDTEGTDPCPPYCPDEDSGESEG